jgi:hypothetical protein
MDGMEKKEGDLFAKSVRAGKRTYFFDVKSTRGNELYLTVTESKKRFTEDGKFTFEKHKIFLYKEDFQKFMEALNEAVNYINENSPEVPQRAEFANVNGDFTDVNFEDLDN